MALPLPTPEFIELARAVPETTMILDHFGTPLVSALLQASEKPFLKNGNLTLQPLLSAQMSS